MKTAPSQSLRIAACLLSSLLSLGGVARATVLINETFESYSDDLKITTGTPWTVTTFTASNYVQVVTNAQSTFDSGTRGMNFYHGGTNANGLTAGYAFAQPVTTGVLTWSFDFRMPDEELNANVFIRLVGTSAANTGPALVFDRSAPGNLYAWNGGGYGNGGNPVAQLNTDLWYRAILEVDLDTRKYSLSLQGGDYTSLTSIFSDYNFVNNTTSSGLTHMQFATNSPSAIGGSLYLDNLFVAAIPEPTTAAAVVGMLALSVALLRRRAHRS